MSGLRPRAREIGLHLGRLPPGPLNAITDVQGVSVGHVSLIAGEDVRTGVTAILPHERDPFEDQVQAAAFVLNGFGKTCGLAQVAELGTLETPILLTNTLSMPRTADAVLDWTLARHPDAQSVNPVVGECNDGYLNDIRGRHIQREHALQALADAAAGPVPEGAVGAGVGMSCFGYKGGIGTASRQLDLSDVSCVLGALVLANFGRPEELVIDGVRIGESLSGTPSANEPNGSGGSVMVVVATDAPLDARQLGRICRRGALGLARTGAIAHHGSGDFVLAFGTTELVPRSADSPFLEPRLVVAESHPLMNLLFQGAVEAVEEAVINALLCAETVTGRAGHVRHALPAEPVLDLLRRADRLRD